MGLFDYQSCFDKKSHCLKTIYNTFSHRLLKFLFQAAQRLEIGDSEEGVNDWRRDCGEEGVNETLPV